MTVLRRKPRVSDVETIELNFKVTGRRARVEQFQEHLAKLLQIGKGDFSDGVTDLVFFYEYCRDQHEFMRVVYDRIEK